MIPTIVNWCIAIGGGAGISHRPTFTKPIFKLRVTRGL